MPDLTFYETIKKKMINDHVIKTEKNGLITPSRIEKAPEPIPDDCTCLECLLRPLQSMFRIFGLDFHFGEEGHQLTEDERKRHKWRKLYSVLVLIFMWLATGRLTASFFMMNWKSRFYFGDISQIIEREKDGSAILYDYLMGHWIASLSLTTYFLTDKTYYLTNMLYLWEDMRSDTARHRKVEKIILAWQKSIIFGTGLAFYGISIYVVLLNMYWRCRDKRYTDDKLNIAFQIFWTSLEKIYYYGMGLYGPAFLAFTNLIIINAFDEYAAELTEGVHGNILETNFQGMQIKYHNLCKYIGLNDQLLRGASNFTFPGLVFMQSLLFYLALFDVALPPGKIYMRIIIVLSIFLFLVTCCYPAVLTAAAQRPYDVLYEATFLPIKVENQFRIHDLMKQIGGSAIGLTWLNVFVITKGAIIKVLSLLISIFIFMVQFQQLHESRECTTPEDLKAKLEFIQD